MKSTRKLISVLLVAMMLLALCSCGAGQTASTPSTDTTKEESAGSASSPAATEKPEEISAETNAGDPQYGGKFVSCQLVAPSSLFYIHMTGSANAFVQMCTEPLGRLSQETKHYEPFLAESFTSSQEEKTFTIGLREGVKFHDGSDLTAEVVKWNLEYMMENGQGSIIGNPESIECPDAKTVVVHYAAYSVDWADKLGGVLISSQKAFEDNGLEYCQNHPVGTGPFVFKEYVPDNYIDYVRNDNYWQEGLPYLDEFKVQIITEWSACMSAFVNKEINTFICGDTPTITALQGMGFEDKSEPNPGGYTLFCVYPNSKVEGDPWSVKEVRQAVLLYGVNWENVALLSGATMNTIVSLQPCIEGAVGYNADLDKESYYDLDKAKSMLTAAGYGNGFTTTIHATPPNIPCATALQDELKNLGITAEIDEITFSDTCRWDGVTPGLHMSNGYSSRDPIANPLSNWYCSASASYGMNIKFPAEYDELLQKGVDAANWDERAEIAEQLLKILCVDEALYRVMNMKGNTTFITDNAHDTGMEYNVITPELIWMDK